MVHVAAAQATFKILGRIVKNFPGTITATAKLEIVRECYALGLKVLATAFSSIEAQRNDLTEMIVKMVRAERPEISVIQAAQLAREAMMTISEMLALGTVLGIVDAVGSPDLQQIYDTIASNNSTPSVQLIHTALALKHRGEFPIAQVLKLGQELKKDPLAYTVLRYVVVQHLYLFRVDFRHVQRLSKALDIPYRDLQATDPQMRMLPRDSSR